MNRWAVPIVVLAALSHGVAAETARFQGLELEQAFDRLEAQGLSIVYSSNLVKPGLVVSVEPTAKEPRAILEEIVRGLGLVVADGPGGTLLLVRPTGAPAGAGAQVANPASAPPPPAISAEADLYEIVVSASRYRLFLGQTAPATALTSKDIELLPVIGEDPVRSLERLPGVARQDFTSKPNMRGGLPDETLVRFDGVRLYNPFHLRDFQAPFSTIDPAIISGLTIFTAGFPVVFGDRMSSVVDVVPVAPSEDFAGRIAASVFNVGARASGSYDSGRGHWLAAARRGNLDMVFDLTDSNLGDPKYSDFHARIDHRIGSGTLLSASALVFDDDLEVFDRDQEEEATAEYRDEYFWVRAEFGGASPGIEGAGQSEAGGRVQAVHTRIESERIGTADLPGVTRGSLEDRRDFTIDSLQGDAWWPLGERSVMQAGAEWRSSTGHYDYRDKAEFAVLFLHPGAPQQPTRSRELTARPDGDQYFAYLNWRFVPLAGVTLDAGLRWEEHALDAASDGHFAPRLGVLWQPDDDTRVRASWGRFYQAQGIDELQVSDGETAFFPAQRADHWVASVERRLGPDIGLRFEAYHKAYDNLRPRFESLLDTLVVLPELRPDRIQIEPESATADGAELSLAYGNGEPLAAWLSYSWSSVTDDTGGRSVRRSWDQTHFLSAGVSHRGPRWELSLAASWRSGWPTTAVELATLEPFPLIATGPRGEEHLGSYARLDARVARRHIFQSGQLLTVFLDISNVTNRRNDCCVEYQLETETGTAVFDVERLESLPLVPTLGFIWEF